MFCGLVGCNISTSIREHLRVRLSNMLVEIRSGRQPGHALSSRCHGCRPSVPIKGNDSFSSDHTGCTLLVVSDNSMVLTTQVFI